MPRRTERTEQRGPPPNPHHAVTMRLPSEIQGTREERVAQFKNDAELMGVATKLVAEVIEKAKGEAMKRRK
ncbi:hypothetical protein FOCC_FOCC012197, partial [Frankliniella occidentalis]